MPSYFNYSPRFLLAIGKASFLHAAYLWLYLFFRTGEREKKERIELNIKAFLEICAVRIDKTALVSFLMVLNVDHPRNFYVLGDCATPRNTQMLLLVLH